MLTLEDGIVLGKQPCEVWCHGDFSRNDLSRILGELVFGIKIGVIPATSLDEAYLVVAHWQDIKRKGHSKGSITITPWARFIVFCRSQEDLRNAQAHFGSSATNVRAFHSPCHFGALKDLMAEVVETRI